jgi:hypothetical protein
LLKYDTATFGETPLHPELMALFRSRIGLPNFSTDGYPARWNVLGKLMAGYFGTSTAADDWMRPRLKEFISQNK